MSAVNVVIPLLGAAFVAAAVAFFIVRYPGLHGRLSADLPGTGPQKFHLRPTPRVGGIPVLLGFAAATAIIAQGQATVFHFIGTALLCGLWAFAGGLAEDFTKRVGVSLRLLLTFASAALGFVILDGRISQLDVPMLDTLLQVTAISFAFTLFAIGGFANAMNIVDGFNGLAAVVSIIFLGAIALVAHSVGDDSIMWASITLSGALLGFLILNFPRGLIFLGDGGAYFVGFVVAELAVLLVHRNSEVSPWFALTLLSYPVVETIFSIYRKKLLRQQSPGTPDGLHLHMLIHKRFVRRHRPANRWANAGTSPYLWLLSLMGAIPAVLFWNSTTVLQVALVAFAIFYTWLYWRIVRFRSPKMLVVRRWADRGSLGELDQDVSAASAKL